MTAEIPEGVATPLVLLESQMTKKEATGSGHMAMGCLLCLGGAGLDKSSASSPQQPTGTEPLLRTRLWSPKSIQRDLTCTSDHVTKLLKTFQHLFYYSQKKTLNPYLTLQGAE